MAKKKPKPNELPLTCAVEGDQFVIRVGLETLRHAAECESSGTFVQWDEETGEYKQNLRITDIKEFAKDVGYALERESESGASPLTNLLDQAMLEAAEDSAGVEEVEA